MKSYYENCAIPKPVNRKKKKLYNGYKDKHKRRCHYCGEVGADRHEIFGGNPNRQTSIKCGFQVDVCREHHMELEANITVWAQEQNQKWAEVYQTAYMADRQAEGETEEKALELWMKLIGRNYLKELIPK